ncbi:MAG: cysteine-rich CWC family protein [Oligoflexia bacterium]|nr:cysteine-rich CWC family protein [Oligoflexia bacterium]
MNICERCGQKFGCGIKTGSCWCQKTASLVPIPKQYKDCLCSPCLETFTKSSAAAVGIGGLIEGEDFYYENGLMVFTQSYHLKKGECCKNDCRHCPY